MFCPSCERQMPVGSRYCGKCGMFFNALSERLLHTSINIGWILRRSMGGFAAGAVSWVFVMALVRAVGMHSFLLCVITGIFLGTVGGIIEDSGYKTFLGGILGCVGGVVGALIGKFFVIVAGLEPLSTYSFLPAWIVMGMAIGATSGIIEKKGKKIIVGMLFGMMGGALGGFLGVEAYGSLVADFMKKETSWFMIRGIEAFSGGIFGATFWFVQAIIEKLYIFKRRVEYKLDKKVCDKCKEQNPFYYWYCVKCGSALQVAAPRDKIKVTPYRSLERTINAFRFLSWLFGASGVITTLVIFTMVIFKNPYFAFLSGVSVGLVSYVLVVVFSFFADMLSSVVKITDSIDQCQGKKA